MVVTPLIISELEICTMLKLGLFTKEIATYTNSSLKSIEGKRYRIRKKINISPDLSLKHWFLGF